MYHRLQANRRTALCGQARGTGELLLVHGASVPQVHWFWAFQREWGFLSAALCVFLLTL